MKQEFAKELAELINRHGLEREFNDTPDYILAGVAIEAMEQFARNSAKRDDWHGFRTADYKKKRDAILNRTNEQNCEGCPLVKICPDAQIKRQPEPERKRKYKKPEAFDVPKEVEAMAASFADMFPGSEIQIQRVYLKENPRNKRRAKNQQKNRKGGRNNER